MIGVFEFLIVVMCIVIGATMMRWHELDKGKAVDKERREAQGWQKRFHDEQLKVTKYESRRVVQAYTEPDVDGVDVPAPLIFGPKEEAELRDNGGFRRQRVVRG